MGKVCENTEKFGLRMLRAFPLQCVLGMGLPRQAMAVSPRTQAARLPWAFNRVSEGSCLKVTFFSFISPF